MALAAIVFSGLGLVPLHAASIVVDNAHAYASGDTISSGDGFGCNLRKALQNSFANAQTYTDCLGGDAGGDTITFTAAVGGTLNQGTISPGFFPNILKPVTITGPMIIVGNGSDSMFTVGTGGSLTLSNMTLSNAGTSAVFISGDGTGHLSADQTAFNNNKNGSAGGGAISASPGSIALSNLCTFTGNTATSTSSGDGGAITLSGTGTSTITATTFTSNTSENHGGAIYFNPSSGGTLSITGGIFIQNTCHAATSASTEGGGAIYTKTPSLTQLTLVDSKFLANTVDGAAGRGGAIFNAFSGGTLLVDHCLFGSPVALTGDSVTGDSTSLGGAIYTRDDMTVRASAFINNSSSGSGGAIASDATKRGDRQQHVLGQQRLTERRRDLQFRRRLERHHSHQRHDRRQHRHQRHGGRRNLQRRCDDQPLEHDRLQQHLEQRRRQLRRLDHPIGRQYRDQPAMARDDLLGRSRDSELRSDARHAERHVPGSSDVHEGAPCRQRRQQCRRQRHSAAFPILLADQRSLLTPIRPAPGGTKCDIGAFESSNAPGYGGPAPGSTINISNLTGAAPVTSNVVISETGTDTLTISAFSTTGGPQITVAGPVPPFSILDGGLSQTLVLSCSSAVAGGFSGTLTASHNATGSPATYTVNCNVVDPLAITTATPLPNGAVGVAYSQTFAATGGTPPYTNWAVTLGAIPGWATPTNPPPAHSDGNAAEHSRQPVQLHHSGHRQRGADGAEGFHSHDQPGADDQHGDPAPRGRGRRSL